MSTLPISLFLFLRFLFSLSFTPPARIRTGVNRVPRTHYFSCFFFFPQSAFLRLFPPCLPLPLSRGRREVVPAGVCVGGEFGKGVGAGVGGRACPSHCYSAAE